VANLLPDFLLALTFFTALVYAVLGPHLERRRPAIAMSTAIGLALAVGLVWWERSHGFSIRDLGPLAVGFAVIILAFVMYQSIRQVGGSWAGAGIALGVSILIAEALGMHIPIPAELISTLVAVALILGVLAFLRHDHPHPFLRHDHPHPFLRHDHPHPFLRHDRGHPFLPRVQTRLPESKPDMSRLFRERHLSDAIERRLNGLEKQSKAFRDRPDEAEDIVQQMKKMLPAEGYLTERMAQLRAKAHQIRNGHIARLDETRHVFATLPTPAKKKAAAELAAGYDQMIGIDTRLERLDKAVAENERRVRELTQKARERATRYDHRGLVDCLKHAERLQKHNSRLFKIIERTEARLTALARQIAARAKQVEQK
jgi:hypothetical protein